MHCQFNISNYSIAVYSNDLWKSRTAPVFEFKEGVWCSICYRDYKSEIRTALAKSRIAV